MNRTGVLLINLGTPDSPNKRDVKRYLAEFLTDPRVIDSPWLKRQLLVRGVIIPNRYRTTAASYAAIWNEKGSPLLHYGNEVEKLLQETLGESYVVKLGMRYQNPSIQSALKSLISQEINHLIVLPLFPQYASATTGSIHEKVMDLLKNERVIPKLTLIDSFAGHPIMLDAYAQQAQTFNLGDYDHILMSFHGLPERQITAADKQKYCLKTKNCCQKPCAANQKCYAAQCFKTAQGIAERLDLVPGNYTFCFQSRLGKEPWMQPYVNEVIEQLAEKGCKRILAFCPSFVCDCLETLYEFGVEYQKEFQKAGGEVLDLVPSLNVQPLWIEAMADIVAKEVY